MKHLLSTIVIAAAVSATAMAERKQTLINSQWTFNGNENVNIPHTWNTDAYTVKDYAQGNFTYTKEIFIDGSEKGRRLFLTFEGVGKYAGILVNGQYAGEHKGGYTAFNIDITPYVRFGQKNTITVEADNSRQDIPPISADFTFFGGIYRDVFLTSVDDVHFDMLNHGSGGVYIDLPQVDEKKATCRIRARISNNSSSKKTVTVTNIIKDNSGKTVARQSADYTVAVGQTLETTSKDIVISDPELWSPDSPVLYTVETRIADKKTKRVNDTQTNAVGLRYFSFSPDKGFFLNGKHLKLSGVSLHQDRMPIGPARNDDDLRNDIRLAKQMGCNFIRLSHYPYDPAVLDECDRLGIMTWEEVPDIDILPDTPGYAETTEENLREMIHQHYNHPSVIMWGYMNEILLVTSRNYKGEEYRKIAGRTAGLAEHLAQVVKEEDPYRCSTIAFHGSEQYNKDGFADITDFVGWNLYQGWYGGDMTGFERFVDDIHSKYPSQNTIISEYGAGSDRRLHSLAPKPFDFSIEYQQLYLEHYLPVIAERDFIIGHSYWNFIDFSSAKRDESMPRINNKGLLYADRTPKDLFYYFKAMNKPEQPLLHIASRDWTVRGGIADNGAVSQPVKVYSTMPEVTLYIDGQKTGTEKTHNHTAVFNVSLSDGRHSLRAVAGTLEDALAIDVMTTPSRIADDPWKTIAVNVGSNCDYTDINSGLTWVADRPYSEGLWGAVHNDNVATSSTTTEIKNTTDDPLWQTALQNIPAYRFDVPEGIYELELGFADIYRRGESLPYLLAKETGQESHDNVFAIAVNGKIMENEFTGEPFLPVIKRYTVEPQDGRIEVSLNAVNGFTYLNTIKLRRKY